MVGCGREVAPSLSGEWDEQAMNRAWKRGVADGMIRFDRSRIAVPPTYTSCGRTIAALSSLECGLPSARGRPAPYRTIGLGQRFSTEAQLRQAGSWPVDPDKFVARSVRQFGSDFTNRDSRRVPREALPPGAEACMRFHFRKNYRTPGEAFHDYLADQDPYARQSSGLYCVTRTEDPPGLLTVAGSVNETVTLVGGNELSPGFDAASEPVLRTLEITPGP